MPNPLSSAKALAERFRFTGDFLRAFTVGDTSSLDQFRDLLYKDGLRISEKTMPELARRFVETCSKLNLPAGSVEAFVHASPEIQAESFSVGSSDCVLRFSSALVELLEGDEFSFVIGHELGHFLLDHNNSRANRELSLELFSIQRAQEISADRVGLISCGSIDAAMRAMMKTVSGLGSKYLKFDIAEFIAQLNKISDRKTSEPLTKTHPPIVLRSRALLWFSSAKSFREFPSEGDAADLIKIDERIISDLNKDVDGILRQRVLEQTDSVRFWLAAQEVVDSGSFDKKTQSTATLMFGEARVQKLKSFLATLTPDEAKAAVEKQVRGASTDLKTLIPEHFDQEFDSLKKEIISSFRKSKNAS